MKMKGNDRFTIINDPEKIENAKFFAESRYKLDFNKTFPSIDL